MKEAEYKANNFKSSDLEKAIINLENNTELFAEYWAKTNLAEQNFILGHTPWAEHIQYEGKGAIIIIIIDTNCYDTLEEAITVILKNMFILVRNGKMIMQMKSP